LISDPLRKKAQGFATEIQAILSKTVAKNIQIRAVASRADDGPFFFIGNRVDKLLTAERFSLRGRKEKTLLWMDVSFQLRLDEEREHLMVQKSFFGVFASEQAREGLCHYDYERDKKDGYPDAHVQIGGHCDSLDALNAPCDKGRTLAKLHFPVGGKRFRPCLEDLIEFLIVERLAVPQDGWEEVLETHRAKFRANQLRAAMRRHPDIVEAYTTLQAQQNA
jgi:hypothetical protein